MGGGNRLGQGEPGLHVPRQGDGLAAQGDGVADNAILGILHRDGYGAGCHVVAAQLHGHLGDAPAHIQLDHSGGRPPSLGLPVGGQVAVDDVFDDVGLVAAVRSGGRPQWGHVHQFFGGPGRQAGGQQTDDGTQGHDGAEYALFQLLHA